MASLRNGFILSFLIGLIGSIALFFVTSPGRGGPPLSGWMEMLVYGLSVCWGYSTVMILLCHKLLENHIRRTSQRREIAGLGGWLDLLFGPGTTVVGRKGSKAWTEARAALLEQLPLLTEEKVSLLNTRDRAVLYRTLYSDDREIIEAVLPILPILNDERALPGVQHLADGKGMASRHPSLQAAAVTTLQRLQADQAQRRRSQGLLRASQPSPTSPQELLHPMQTNNETDPQVLLRADRSE